VSDGDSGELRGRVMRGLGWSGASQIGLQICRTAVAIGIARLLTPSEYGLAALALVITSLVLVFSDLALGAALVQRKSLTSSDRNTAFWATIACGVIFTVLGVALAGPIASVYGEPDVEPLMAALAPSFLITAVGATQQSLMLRDMDFRRLEVLIMAGSMIGGVAAIIVAALGGGAWAIVAQQLGIALATTILVWRASSWRPQLDWSRGSFHYLASFSLPLMGHRLLFYIHANADRLLIGRFAGTSALGAYTMAYNVMLSPAGRIGGPIQRVLAPAFARMQDEPERISRAWARVTRFIGVIVVPALLGIAATAPDFIDTVLGHQWHAATPVLAILCWVGILQALQSIDIDILMARDRTSTAFRYAITFTIAHLTAFAIGLHWGIIGVAVAYAISSTLVEPLLTVLTARALGVSPFVVVRAVTGVFAAGVAMALCVLGARLALDGAGVPLLPRFAACVVLGAVIYLPLCWWWVPELRAELADFKARRGGAPSDAVPASSEMPAPTATPAMVQP